MVLDTLNNPEKYQKANTSKIGKLYICSPDLATTLFILEDSDEFRDKISSGWKLYNRLSKVDKRIAKRASNK